MVPFAPGVLCLGGGKAPKHSGPDFLVGVSIFNHIGVKHKKNPLYPEKLLLDSCIRLGESFPAMYNCPMRFWLLHSVIAL